MENVPDGGSSNSWLGKKAAIIKQANPWPLGYRKKTAVLLWHQHGANRLFSP